MRGTLWITVCVPLLTGCPVPARLTTGYQPTPIGFRAQPLAATLTVRRFSDARPPRLYSTQARLLLARIPFVPWAAMARAGVRVALTLRDTGSGAVVWQETVEGEASKTFNDAYTSPILYGPSVSGFITPIPPADWPVDDRSVFAFHFEALRRAMAKARSEIAAALAGA